MNTEIKTCTCGWRRPVIALTTRDGQRPPPHVVPTYECPQCGEFYICGEVSIEKAAQIRDALDRELAAVRKS